MIIPGYIDSEFRVSARAFRAGVGAKLDIYIYIYEYMRTDISCRISCRITKKSLTNYAIFRP
jgi:hypothetical protein